MNRWPSLAVKLDQLTSGDCLLYKPKKSSIFGWLISIKTWHKISHCEVYVGDGLSAASRDGLGVDIYPVRLSELVEVYRPKSEYKFDINKALIWFMTKAKGQKYDWVGLLRFTWGQPYVDGDGNNKQFCSEFLTRFYRAGGMDPFNGEDADAIAPFMLSISPVFSLVWSSKDKLEQAPQASQL